MIRIVRGPEPPVLAAERQAGLARLQEILKSRPLCSQDFGDTYTVVKEELRLRQHRKCCYCEAKSKQRFNDLEHFRPKTRADRSPGCAVTDGYWWLAWTWENLLYACPSCNRSEKNDRFPLGNAAILAPGQAPPGLEQELLIDPAGSGNPMQHIRFEWRTLAPPDGTHHWYAVSDDLRGRTTIRTFGLNEGGLPGDRDDYAEEYLEPHWDGLLEAIREQDHPQVRARHSQATALLRASKCFTALAYDALTQNVPDKLLAPFSLRWPRRVDMPLPATRR